MPLCGWFHRSCAGSGGARRRHVYWHLFRCHQDGSRRRGARGDADAFALHGSSRVVRFFPRFPVADAPDARRKPAGSALAGPVPQILALFRHHVVRRE
ncbi:unnamed protein product [Symbiodinium sp. CCMP2592]|nr:unnamed protein product [Symbiodinium sp. CCMP2592]